MEFKRPFETEELYELPFKHPKYSDSSIKLSQFADIVNHNNNTSQRPHISEVEGGFCKYQWDEAFQTSDHLSLITGTSCEEDTDSGAASISPVSSEYLDFDFSQRMFAGVEDACSLLLDQSPRKHVPLGPNHQANVPSWGRQTKKYKFALNGASEIADNDYEEIMMGTCIIPNPDSDLFENYSGKVGDGKTDCSCLDRGSVRCVQQHVMEARKELKKSVGHEKFVKLGFYDMGEDVEYKWSEEDEEMFHEVVYSNPASLGKKFWKRLSSVFPSRHKRELVSYYFNVFILQRRAVQNRSSILDIDSDADEWHGSQQAYEVESSDDEEDEDCAMESRADQEDLANNEGECLDKEDNDDDSSDSDGDSGVIDYQSASIREDYSVNILSKGDVADQLDESSRFNSVFEPTDNVSGLVEDFNGQDDSCVSFEFHPNRVVSHSLIDTKVDLPIGGMNNDLSKCLQSEVDVSSELGCHVYLLDTCDTKSWDARYPTALTEGIDLQPTCNIIEEIFGRHLGHQGEEK